MPRIVQSTIVDAPTEAVWAVLRDFNGHDRWHPAVATARSSAPVLRQDRLRAPVPTGRRVGAARAVADAFRCRTGILLLLLDTPMPLLNYVAHVRLLPVTDGDRTFWHWESRFTTPARRPERMHDMVAENIYRAGFEAVREHMKAAATRRRTHDQSVKNAREPRPRRGGIGGGSRRQFLGGGTLVMRDVNAGDGDSTSCVDRSGAARIRRRRRASRSAPASPWR